MLIIPLLFIISAALAGITVVSALQLVTEKVAATATGVVIGLCTTTFLLFVLNTLLPPTLPWLIIVMLALLSASYIGLTRYRGWRNWRHMSVDRSALNWTILLFILFTFIAPKLLLTTSDGLGTGIINNYGDVAYHVELITSFAAGQTTPPTNPIYAGIRLAYPFLSDFTSALLVTAGASLAHSIMLPTLVLLPALFVLFFLVTKQLTGSKEAASMALLLFLFAGSTFGWLQLATDIKAAESLTEFWHTQQRFYYSGATDATTPYHLINPLISLILPQRSLLFGIPVALIIILLLTRQDRPNRTTYLVAGALAGMLPLWHAHTVIALTPVIIGLIWLNRDKQWLYFFLPAAILGLPQVLYYLTAEARGAALTWHPGWMTPPTMSVLYFWLLNAGLLVPAAIAGVGLKAPQRLRVVGISGLLLFVSANLWLVAQWEWDNTKLLVYWLVFTLPVVGWLTVTLMKRLPQWAQVVIITVVALHGISGLIDIAYLVTSSQQYTVWNTAAVTFASEVQEVVPKRSVIVTAPVHNSSIELTGRPRYIGYSGHVWSHGINGFVREQAVADFYEGRQLTLPEVQTSYALVSPSERSRYPKLVIQPTWQLVVDQGAYQLYKISR